MKTQRKLILLFSIIGTFLYIVLSQYQLNQQRKDSVSAFSDTGKGMSLFSNLLKELRYGEVNIYRRPLIYYEDLAKVQGLAILSPRMPISSKEAKTVFDFVNNGGKLILSAHDKDSADRLRLLLRMFDSGTYTAVETDPEFENYKVRHIVSDIDDEVFQKNETYTFYSNIFFSHRPTCASRKEVSCFYYSQEVGRGLVFYFLGLPLHSNGLIQMEFNRFFAYRMARLTPRLIVDEYHHLFPTKDWTDLALDWQYSLPLVGLFIGSILFFIFARRPEPSAEGSLKGIRNLHDVGERLLVQNMGTPNVLLGARRLYRQFLEKRYSLWHDQIDHLDHKLYPQIRNEDTRVQVQAREWIQLHQAILKEKKGEKVDDLHKPNRQPDL